MRFSSRIVSAPKKSGRRSPKAKSPVASIARWIAFCGARSAKASTSRGGPPASGAASVDKMMSPWLLVRNTASDVPRHRSHDAGKVDLDEDHPPACDWSPVRTAREKVKSNRPVSGSFAVKDGIGRARGLHEERVGAAALAKPFPVGGRQRSAPRGQQHDRGRADLVDIGDQALRGIGKAVSAPATGSATGSRDSSSGTTEWRCNFGLDGARIDRKPQFGACCAWFR